MSVAPTARGIPKFVGTPLASFDDATVYLHAKDLPELGRPAEHGFTDVSEYLREAAAPPPRVAVTGTTQPGSGTGDLAHRVAFGGQLEVHAPRLSAAGEVHVRRPGEPADGPHRTARGLACSAERGRAVSITLRSVTKTDADELDTNLGPPAGVRNEHLKAKFAPSKKYSPNKKPCWYSLKDQCGPLFEAVFGGTPKEVQAKPAQGLVVLTGATNSAKSQIAMGLIHTYLEARKEAGKKPGGRRPHLVTFEDPIESFLYEPQDLADLSGLTSGNDLSKYIELDQPETLVKQLRSKKADRASDEYRRKLREKYYAWLSKLPKTLLAQWAGYDYTPRERGTDVRDLRQAFADALRQTPSVFYIGEIRDPNDWPAVLEFAGTGHLVITTAHAGSLLEAVVKILSATAGETASARRQCAARIRAVVHLRPWLGERELGTVLSPPRPLHGSDLLDYATLLLPSVWRQTEPGLAALAANGYGAIVPACPADREGAVSGLGRRWFAKKLFAGLGDNAAARNAAARVAWTRDTPKDQPQVAAWTPTDDDIKDICTAIEERAAKADLKGE